MTSFADFTFTVQHHGIRQTQILHDDMGFTYSSPLMAANGALRWRCSKKSSKSCNAFIILRGEEIVRCQRSHNHWPDIEKDIKRLNK
jgi:hypothetical protein